MLSARPHNWLESWSALSAVDVFDKLPTLRMPTRVIAGELDVSCSPELMRRDIAERIPGARFQVLPGASHMVTLVKGRELGALLLQDSP